MAWEPDLSKPIDEFEMRVCDIFTGNFKEEPFSVIPYFERLDLMEDIDSPFLQGTLQFSVLKGEMQSLGMSFTMQDFLLIEVSSLESIENTSKPSQLTEPRFIGGLFYITDILKKEVTNPKVDSYTIHFASTEVLSEYSRKISKSYKNKTRQDIIKTITNDFLVKDSRSEQKLLLGEFEETRDDYQCIIPNWSPIKSIMWLSKGCISRSDSDSKSFYFFQRFEDDLDRSFNFQSLNTMMKQKPSVGNDGDFLSGYAITPHNSDLNEKTKRTFSRRTPLRCVTRNISGLDRLSKGLFSSKLLSHDMVRKTFTEKTFEYDNSHVANKDTNVGLVLEENSVQEGLDKKFLKTGDCYVTVTTDHKNLFRKSETNLGVDKTEDWFQGRLTQKNIKDYITMDIVVYGDTNRNVGQTVMFTSAGLYDNDDDSSSKLIMDQEGIDLAGKYMITKVVHTFSKDDQNGSLGGKNTTTMTLVKDGWQQS